MSLMLHCIIGFSLSLVAVFGKSFQQLNVQHRRKLLIFPTSMVQSLTELFRVGVFMSAFSQDGYLPAVIVAICIAIGSGVGCILGIDAHEVITKKIYKWHIKKGEK